MISLFTEALSVGLITAVVGSIISLLFMFLFSKDFKIAKYSFWPQVFVSYFVTGLVIHLILEWTGVNKKFCCGRYTCT